MRTHIHIINREICLKAAAAKPQLKRPVVSISSRPVGLASCLWLVGTVLYLDMASGHEPTFYALVMNNSLPSVVDNGDRPGARTRRFLQQDSSYRSVI